MSIWKDPKVELPELNKRIYLLVELENKTKQIIHALYRYDRFAFKKYFFLKCDDLSLIYTEDSEKPIKWCYEEDLIKQAEASR